jgi:hypothetical protein
MYFRTACQFGLHLPSLIKRSDDFFPCVELDLGRVYRSLYTHIRLKPMTGCRSHLHNCLLAYLPQTLLSHNMLVAALHDPN